MQGKTIDFFGWHADALTLICLLLFMGAMGKSAQFLLHTWLPDAMEGPTPVSALIHAATMVTAGVFMVARLSPLFELAPNAQAVVMFFGATTAFFAATIGLVQNDIKRIVAYSTCSQLGYMFVAMGAGAYSVGMFHLFTHAFFKALLFLGSGSVIYAMHHEQDIRNMGGLKDKIPYTYIVMVIGTLALTGFPLTAGYFSKDAIIESAYVAHNPFAFYGFLMTVIAAGLTSFYSWRLIFKTFHGEPHDQDHYEAAHESADVDAGPDRHPRRRLDPGRLPVQGTVRGPWRGGVLPRLGQDASAHHRRDAPHPAGDRVPADGDDGARASWCRGCSTSAGPICRSNSPTSTRCSTSSCSTNGISTSSMSFIFVRPAKWLGYFLWKKGDGYVIDGFGPDGVSARVLDVTRNVVKIQTGYLYHYAFAMLIGVAGLITWFMFGLGGQ